MAANPDVQGWREWDDRYADLVEGSRNWQIATAVFSIPSLLSVWCALGRAERSKWAPPAPRAAGEPLGGRQE
jgi:hypothetical protein